MPVLGLGGVSLPLSIRSRLGEEIGVVLSGASSIAAPVALHSRFAGRAREEMMVAVHDQLLGASGGCASLLLGKLRFITRYEPFLRRGLPNVYVYEPSSLDSDLLTPFTNAYVEFYGVATVCFDEGDGSLRGRLEPPVYAPHPGSRVYLLDRPDVLEAVAGGSGLRVGRHPYTGWEPPIDPEALRMHVGVFGATGMGKSRLVRRLAREASRRYAVIIFDHSGVDYAPAARAQGYPVFDGSRVRLDEATIAEVLVELMDIPSSLEDYVYAAVHCHEGIVSGRYGDVRSCLSAAAGLGARRAGLPTRRAARRWTKQDFIATLVETARALNARDSTVIKLRLYAERVPDHVYLGFGSRSIDPADIIAEALRSRIVVVDLGSEEEIAAKRAIIAQVVDEAWGVIHELREPIDLAVFVDEAQHYACEYCRPSNTRLEKIAREGRKWGLWLLVASQRFSRDIRPGIRANLGTIFFSRLQAATDLNELAGYLDLGNVTQASLAMLSRRQFYLAGLANPLGKPVLIEVSHVPDNGF